MKIITALILCLMLAGCPKSDGEVDSGAGGGGAQAAGSIQIVSAPNSTLTNNGNITAITNTEEGEGDQNVDQTEEPTIVGGLVTEPFQPDGITSTNQICSTGLTEDGRVVSPDSFVRACPGQVNPNGEGDGQ